MTSYEPPTSIYPIFDSLVFQTPNSASITIAEADARYLARNNIATSNATLTSFAGDITVGSSRLDYTSGTGLAISGTANTESIFMNVLNGAGVTKLKVELNPAHIHLYDTIRFTDSSIVTSYSTLQQVTTNLTLNNLVNGSTTDFKNNTAGGASVTPLSLTALTATINLPITLGYTSTPSSGQLGFVTRSNANASTAITSNTIITLITGGFNLTAGTYLIKLNGYNTTTAVAGSVTSYELGLSTSSTIFTGGFVDNVLGTYSVPAIAGSITGSTCQVLNVTATTTYYFNHRMIFTTIVPSVITSSTYIQYTRIA